MKSIKLVDFNHSGSFRLDRIINLIKKIERKFSDFINQARLRCTVEGKSLMRVTPNYDEMTMTLLLPHQYTKKNKQAKLLLSLDKNISKKELESFLISFKEWLNKNV